MTPNSIVRRLLPIFLILALFGCDDQASGANDKPSNATRAYRDLPKRVLFVGNSFTYFNGGIDQHVRNLLAHLSINDRAFLIAEYTQPNQTFAGHLRDENLIRQVRHGNWDIVVLQAASYEATDPRTQDAFLKNGIALANIVQQSQAEPVFFMTWPYKSQPAMLDALESGYRELGQAAHASVIPVGTIWMHLQSSSPDVPLYSDERHPSLNGTLLAACVFYAALYHEQCANNPYDGGLDRRTLTQLQDIVNTAGARESLGAYEYPSKQTRQVR